MNPTTDLDVLKHIVNTVRANKHQPPIEALRPETLLREEIGFDSMDLAELTVRIEEAFGIDVFADGLVSSIREVQERISVR